MRPVVAALFAVAVASTVLAGDGLVLVPHTHAPGTPAEHPHGLALYRFPIALLGEPSDAPRLTPDQNASPAFRMATPLGGTLAGMSLLLIIGLAALVGAPSARPRWAVGPVRSEGPQWAARTPTGPPRLRPIV